MRVIQNWRGRKRGREREVERGLERGYERERNREHICVSVYAYLNEIEISVCIK